MADGRGPVTAAEFIAEQQRRLREEPDYRAAFEQASAQAAALAKERRQATLPLLKDLRDVGVEVESLWELDRQPALDDAAMPVLLDHLRRDYSEEMLLEIGFALSFYKSKTWWDDLAALYLETSSDAVRDRVAAALAARAVKAHYEDLLRFISVESLGDSRVYFLRPINRIGNRVQPGTGRAVIQSVAGIEGLKKEAKAILAGRSHSQ